MNRQYRTRITDTAASDIFAAYEWIETGAPEHASEWVAGLLDAIASLEIFPDRCALAPENDDFRDEIRVHLYRKSSVYRILFTIQDDLVVILHVRHSAQQFVIPENQ